MSVDVHGDGDGDGGVTHRRTWLENEAPRRFRRELNREILLQVSPKEPPLGLFRVPNDAINIHPENLAAVAGSISVPIIWE